MRLKKVTCKEDEVYDEFRKFVGFRRGDIRLIPADVRGIEIKNGNTGLDSRSR